MAKPDFVAELLDVVAKAVGVDAGTTQRIERAIRDRFGGQEVKIRSRAPICMDTINAGLRDRKSVRQIAGEQGVSRATIYRHLGKSRKSRPKVTGGAG